MNFVRLKLLCLFIMCSGGALAQAQDAAAPYLGRWALTIPGGGAGWLKITNEAGYLDGSILWGGGSVVPVESVVMDGDQLVVVRLHEEKRRDEAGQVVRTQRYPELLRCKVEGEIITIQRNRFNNDGLSVTAEEFSGTRIPDLPPAPDLSAVQYGEPITLFNGQDLSGWTLTNPDQVNGWSVAEGVLVNNPAQEEGQPKKSYGNLRTEQEFEDFNLTMEVMVPPGGNSGVYLRGVYEVQVLDSYGRPSDPHHMAGIYSRITPSYPAEKPAGEWQTLNITLLDRHVTVILNGITVVDNAPLEGCTGGALWSDEFRPGPIYLQGDHTGVSYRDMVLRPIVKPAAAEEAPATADAPSQPRDMAGQQAPVFTLPLLGGGTLDTAAFRGEKYLVLDFWTTWCPWCRASTDKFVELSKKYADQDIGFYMVSVGEQAETVRRYFEVNQIAAQIAIDTDRAVSDKYLVDYIPHVVVIDKEGKIVLVTIGKDEVEERLSAKLAELFPDTPKAP